MTRPAACPTTRAAALALAVLLPLSACGGGDDDGGPAAAPAPAPSAPAGATGPADAPAATPVPGASLVLRGGGLALSAGGATTDLPFGSGTSVVVPALAAVLGAPEQQSVECGQGPRTAVGSNGFDVLFDGDRFVGWDDSTGQFTTEGGLKVGSTRADVVRTQPDAQFSVSTLGPQFTTPSGLGGFLDGETDAAVVTGLTGGETCVAS